ncbi:Mitochondrial inner membrane organizing system component [Diplodia seriata]|uniref:MICOS complex subunit MIC10 n=1 Tax=Diplodia seriata TaxID=420778 RepID=A0ABR3CSX4_9PEZI
MAEENISPAPQAPVARPSRPMSEALLNDKVRSIPLSIPSPPIHPWDRCLSSMLIRSGLGLSFGIVFSVLLFKRRAWPAFVGLGFGAGRAWEECDNSFKNAAAPSRDGLRVYRQ